MPLISTAGAASASGFGFIKGRPVITYVFPAGTSSFTVPSGVTSLVSAVGKGADGSAGSWGSASIIAQAWATGYSFGSGGSSSVDWGTLYSQIQSHQSTVNAGGSGERTLNIPSYSFEIYATGSSTNLGVIYTSSFNATIRGTGSITSIGSPPSSGTITYTQVLNNTRGYYLSGLEIYSPGSTGASTTGFGLSFPGGNSGPASLVSYSNVNVTPGTTYTIVNNGSLTITY